MMSTDYFRQYVDPDHGFKEMSTLEINFPEEDPVVMRHILNWMESKKVDEAVADGSVKSVTYAAIFKSADMYQVQELKNMVARTIQKMTKRSFVKVIMFFKSIARFGIIDDPCFLQIKTHDPGPVDRSERETEISAE